MAKMVEIHETTFEALNESKIALDKIVRASETIRECNGNQQAENTHALKFGLDIVKILKEYLGDEY